MTEEISNPYDIARRAPVSLEKLSAIAVSLEVWRREVNEYRKSHTLDSFNPYRPRIPLKAALPELPSVIYNIIYRYVVRFRFSVDDWVSEHYDRRRILGSGYGHRMNFVENFDDFVCDHYGSVHYVRTAERMMRCDKFNDVMKFSIACMYFLEDDIERMWPFVSNSIDIDSIKFHEYPHVYYWICRLTNKLDKIRPSWGNATIDGEMFDQYSHQSTAALEYFWNGMSREKQMQKAFHYDGGRMDTDSFINIILPLLDDQQLNEFFSKRKRGCGLIGAMFTHHPSFDEHEQLVLRIWLCIRNIINASEFKTLVKRMLTYRYCSMKDDNKDNAEHFKRNEVVGYKNEHAYLCCDIWNTSPLNLKSSVIRDLLPGTRLLKFIFWDEDESVHEDEEDDDDFKPSLPINVELLLLILRCASNEERSSFWNNCWHLLIVSARDEELQRIMNLCFGTREHEIAEFKLIMAKSDKAYRLCVRLLREGEYFNLLNGVVSFMLPEMHNARNFKQKILRECLILRPRNAEKFNGFITSAYNDVDLSAVKNQLMPKIRDGLWSLIRKKKVPVEQIAKFLDTFFPTEETVVQIKMSIIDSCKEYVTDTAPRRNQDVISERYLNSILLWCLGSDEEVDKFKLTCAS